MSSVTELCITLFECIIYHVKCTQIHLYRGEGALEWHWRTNGTGVKHCFDLYGMCAIRLNPMDCTFGTKYK